MKMVSVDWKSAPWFLVSFLIGVLIVLGYRFHEFKGYPPRVETAILTAQGLVCGLRDTGCMAQLSWLAGAQQPVVELIGESPRPARIAEPQVPQARAIPRVQRTAALAEKPIVRKRLLRKRRQ